MPRLTQARINTSKPADRAYKVFDSDGLFLLVKPSGAVGWRVRYRWNGRERQLSVGPYPAISLAQARERRDALRTQLRSGADPSRVRKEDRAAHANSFREVAKEWLAKQPIAANTRVRNSRVLGYLIKELGERSLREIEAPDMLEALCRIEKDSLENAKRARQLGSAVFQYAIASRRAKQDPAAGLARALTTAKTVHRPALTEPKAVGDLLRSIDGYRGHSSTVAALRTLALVFVRPSELRNATWSEIDLDGAQWVIPAERMKMRREHVVPLATQTVELLSALPRTGTLVFPSLRPQRPLSENTLNVALRGIGYDTKTQQCAHGFRSTASTLLHELGFPAEVIELQLAHAQRSQVAAAYNRSTRLQERRVMMQSWANYLDELRAQR